jgi:hypothetical protein
VSHELEAAAADSLSELKGGRREPAPGARCANCGVVLQGPFCHGCGQTADNHKRSIFQLTWEAVEDMFHLDGRLSRTLPDLFLRPGRLARDYIEGRLARHVPPFRMFLVALLLFIFAAEYATHRLNAENQRQQARQAAALATPQGRAAEVARLRAEAISDRTEALKEAASDRADDLKDPDDARARVEARYAKAIAKANADFEKTNAKAARVAAGEPEQPATDLGAGAGGGTTKLRGGWKAGLHKAVANPEYYLAVLFAWGHRMAVLLLPIVGLTLALAYRNKPRFFIHDHMLVAMNLLSFAFLTNAAGLALPFSVAGYWLGLVALWTPVNLFQTLRGAYGSSLVGATLKTLLVWSVTVFSFTVLLVGLMVFVLGQL